MSARCPDCGRFTRDAHTHNPQVLAQADDIERSLRLAGYGPSTAARIGKHVRKFAADTGATDLWTVTAGQVDDWLATQPAQYGASLRTAYRWAASAGRVESNPCAPRRPGPARREPPPAWREPLAAFRKWMVAQRMSGETITMYRGRLIQLAYETGRGPFELDGEALCTWLSRHRWSRQTAHSSAAVLAVFYRWAYNTGRADANLAADIPRVRLGEGGGRRPPALDIYRAALASASPRVRVMLRLAGELGLRRGEIARITHADMVTDTDGAWLTVHGKGGKKRVLPVPEGLAAEMAAWWDSHDSSWLFPQRWDQSAPISPQTASKSISRLLPVGVSAHHLRHMFGTLAYAETRDLLGVQRLLGHVSPATTRT